MNIKAYLTSGGNLGKELRGQAVTLQSKTSALVRHFGQLLRTRIMANASGRPGPNAPTGDYRRSWVVDITTSGSTTTADVGTNAPQGPRLEFGFHGADSLGRMYNQPPYAHVGPAVDWLDPQLDEGFGALIPS